MALGTLSDSEALSCANNLKQSSTNMTNLFNDLKNEMNSLESVLKSEASDQLLATYKELEAKLDGFPSKIDDFEVFLRNAVAQYQADDKALESEL